MKRDVLYLLKEAFPDGGGLPYFCPDCAYINGVLSYFPSLRHRLDIRYVDFPRPRQEIVDLIGLEHQGCPVLILSSPPAMDAMQLMTVNPKDDSSSPALKRFRNTGPTFTVYPVLTSPNR